MSTVVLARKYRPRDFQGLVGQEHVVQALSHALSTNRLHHAYLFTGTRGVGKTTISRILAKALNCSGADGQGDVTATPCGVCPACRDIDAGRYVDYVELDAASNRGVEEISQLLDQAVYKPVVGRYKVYMIDEVHMLSTTAFNAMLKTLEEPPSYLKFVLATTDPQKVPPTVLSRCLQFNLRPMSPQTVQSYLQQVLVSEDIQAEAGALRLLSRAAHGSMRDALSLTDQAIAFGGGRVDEAGVRQMLGAVDSTHALRMLQAVAAGDGAALVAGCDALRDLGLSAAGLLDEMASLLQQIAVLQAVPSAADPEEGDPEALATLAGQLVADEVQLHYSIVLHGRAELGLAPDEHGGLTMVLLRMLAFRPDGSARPTAPPTRAAASGPKPALAPSAAVARHPVPPSPRSAGAAAAPGAAGPSPSARLKAATERGAAPATWPDLSVERTHAATPAPPPNSAAQARDVLPTLVPPRDSHARVSASAAMDEPPPWLDVPDAEDGPSQAELDDRPPAMAATHESPRSNSPAPNGAPDVPAPLQSLPTPTALDDRWVETVSALVRAGSISAMAKELAMQAQLIGVEAAANGAAVWRLRVERESLRGQAQRDKLQAALAQHLGHPVTLELDAGVALDSPSLRDAAERARRQREAEQAIHDDPFVRQMLSQFRTARIVPGSIRPL